MPRLGCRSRGGILRTLAITAGLFAILVSGLFIWGLVSSARDRARAREFCVSRLSSASTEDQLLVGVSGLGVLIVRPDRSWVAIQDRDSHYFPGYSVAIALTSDSRRFESDVHFCGAFSSRRQAQERRSEALARPGITSEEKQKLLEESPGGSPELHSIETATTMDEAIAALQRLGFTRMTDGPTPALKGPLKPR